MDTVGFSKRNRGETAQGEAAAAKSEMRETAESLAEEVRALRAEVARLNDHRFLRTYNSTWKFLAFNLLRGIAVALGGVIGATVVLSMLIWSLSQIEFIPIIGDWARQIADIVQTGG